MVRAGLGMLCGMTNLVERLLPDELWQRIQPLLPPHHPVLAAGCRVGSRTATVSPPWCSWPAPPPPGVCSRPRSWGCGPATTCWRRFDEWARAGVFEQLQAALLDELGETGRIDLERVSVDSFSLRAVKVGT